MQDKTITSSKELQEAIEVIQNKETTTTLKNQEIRTLLSNQIKIRKKLLKQNIDIKFSHSRRQRALSEIILELSDYIDQHFHELPIFLSDPSRLVGHRISHKFETEESNEVKWYTGNMNLMQKLIKYYMMVKSTTVSLILQWI